jgi:membrane protein
MEKITNSRLWRWIKTVLDFLRPMRISVHSAYTAFFLILSVFPASMILVGVLGYTSLEVEDVISLIAHVVPEPLLPLARRLLSGAYDATSAPVLSISAVTAIWSASRGVLGLKEGLNAIYGVKEQRGYFLTRGISMLYTVLFVAMLVLSLVLNVFGTTLMQWLPLENFALVQFLWELVDWRFVLMLLLQTGLFTAMFMALPNRHNTFRQSVPGALLASVGWLVFSDLFSIYVENFSGYANIFGSVYAVALSMLWLYFCISIVFYGGALNQYLISKKQ